MKGLVILFLFMGIIGVMDMKTMINSGLKRETVPYIILLLLAGTLGALYLTDPIRPDIVSSMLKFFQVDW